MNKRKRSFSLLRPPASAQVGIPDDGVLVESGVEVKDDVRSFDEVNVESASGKNKFPQEALLTRRTSVIHAAEITLQLPLDARRKRPHTSGFSDSCLPLNSTRHSFYRVTSNMNTFDARKSLSSKEILDFHKARPP